VIYVSDGCGGCSSAGEIKEDDVQNTHDTIKLTEIAAKKVNDLRDSDKSGLRISVAKGGCAGYSYVMEFDESKENDNIIKDKGVTLIVDKESFELLKGTTIDYAESLQASGFKINNPNSKASCGCGKSSAF
jgi:iron-sulfur cluster assembly protein